MPRIGWRNWIRLALIPAGGDHRDLPGVLGLEEPRRARFRRYQLTRWDAPTPTIGGSGSNGAYGVQDPRVRDAYDHGYAVLRWEQPSFTVAGGSHPGQGAYSVADPRVDAAAADVLEGTPEAGFANHYRVRGWDDAAQTVTGSGGSNAQSVADPRVDAAGDVVTGLSGNYETYGVTAWDRPACTITGASRPGNGRFSVADPRILPQAGNPALHDNKYRVRAWDQPALTVIGASRPGSGAQSVADPRFGAEEFRCPPQRAGAYGVLQWAGPAFTVTGAARIDNGSWSIADPRLPEAAPFVIEDLDGAPEDPPVIVSPDGTWHRPLTTLELAILQGFPARHDGAPLELAGSLTSCRARIGNAVPPPAARAIANQMLVTLVHADLGRFALSSDAVWVDPAEHVETDITAWPLG
jgi:site-specific DNA-cytosine methylase